MMEPKNPSLSEDQLQQAVAEDAAAQLPAATEADAESSRKRTRKKVAEPVADAGADVAPAETVEEAAAHETVDFSEEDAALAGDAPEFDLGEEHEHEKQEAEEAEAGADSQNFAGKSKRELVETMQHLLETKPVQSLRRDAEAIKIAFYKLHRAEVDQLRRASVEAGGVAEDFEAPADADEKGLKELFAEYRRRRDEFITSMEHTKEENLKIKLKIIEDLKELIDSGETINHTFNAFRDLQSRWRETGPVPLANNKDIWETYNLHVERFYNYIKINKELRDLDLKRNYEAKTALAEQAEALILEPSVVTAFHKLQKLHDQWRETGPVAAEYKETLWTRFREASARINKQHQEHFEGIKEEQKRNLDLKAELCTKAEELSAGPFTSRKEWNKASEKLIEIQKVWKTIGFAPKKENTRIYERFRKACDELFSQKRNFYQQLKSEMDINLQLKQEICDQAEALAASEDWARTSDDLIALQKRWKEIGPVPRRHSDAVWKRFRAACDAFFTRKSEHFSSVGSEHENNLKQKEALLAEIEAFDMQALTFDDIKNFQRRWSEIGFVPIKHKESVQARYKKLMDALFSAIRGKEGERRMDRFRDHVSSLRSGGGKKLRSERDRLYNKVKQLESDIAVLENNIGFFSRSKNAEAMIHEVNLKIQKAKDEMAATIEKINLIDKENNA